MSGEGATESATASAYRRQSALVVLDKFLEVQMSQIGRAAHYLLQDDQRSGSDSCHEC